MVPSRHCLPPVSLRTILLGVRTIDQNIILLMTDSFIIAPENRLIIVGHVTDQEVVQNILDVVKATVNVREFRDQNKGLQKSLKFYVSINEHLIHFQ